MNDRDAAWLDRQYDNRANVPEHPAILARWADRSGQARSMLHCELDVAYGNSAAETLDVFPASQPGAPVLVFIHGGYWRSLDKSHHSFIAPALVGAGATVVVPNYSLCPAVDIATIALQMVRALIWTWRNVERFGGDPQRIVVAGHSAGGHLATMLLCCDWRSQGDAVPPSLLKGALSISGLYDLAPVQRVGFLKDDLRLDDEQVRRLSPVRFPAPAGPLLTAAGAAETDEFRRQNRLMEEAWGPFVVPQVLEVAAANHFTVLDSFADAGQPLHAAALELLGLAGAGRSTSPTRSEGAAQPAASR